MSDGDKVRTACINLVVVARATASAKSFRLMPSAASTPTSYATTIHIMSLKLVPVRSLQMGYEYWLYAPKSCDWFAYGWHLLSIGLTE